MSSSVGGVMSIVMFFCNTASLPRKSEASRAVMRSTAGPSFTPGTFASATAIFFSPTGWANCSVARFCSVLPCDSVTAKDFKPVPLSVTWISTGATPTTSASGDTAICGGSDSKRGRRYRPPPASAAITITRRRTTTENLPRERLKDKALIDASGGLARTAAGRRPAHHALPAGRSITAGSQRGRGELRLIHRHTQLARDRNPDRPFLTVQALELRWRCRLVRHTELRVELTHALGIRAVGDQSRYPIDDLAREPGGREHPDPAAHPKDRCIESLLNERRCVGQPRRTQRRGDGQRADRARSDVGPACGVTAYRRLDAPSDHLLPHRRLAFVLHDFDPGAVELVHLLRDHVRGRAGSVRAHVDRLRAGERYVLFCVFRGHVAMDGERQGPHAHGRDESEVLVRIERHLLVKHTRWHDRTADREQERVPVGRCLGYLIGTDQTAAAGTVLDDHRLADSLTDIVTVRVRIQIGEPARSKADDETDRATRPTLRA